MQYGAGSPRSLKEEKVHMPPMVALPYDIGPPPENYYNKGQNFYNRQDQQARNMEEEKEIVNVRRGDDEEEKNPQYNREYE